MILLSCLSQTIILIAQFYFTFHIIQLNDNIFLSLTGLVADAMNKYTEALTASDFSKANGNLDVLVIPVLCNLAACCIQIGNLVSTLRCVSSL